MKLHWMSLFFLLPFLTSCSRPPYSSGEAVYEGECAQCHKLNGKGGDKGPDLSDIFQKQNEAYIRSYTQDPREIKPDSVMPPAKLSDPELNMLVEYLKEQNRHASDGPK
jgi:mono/diheme cytochrome c family protein